MTKRVPPAISVLILATLLAIQPGDVQGCAGAYYPGARVDVADETALIVWDEAAQKEHFIRRATFVGTAYDFGFLVPSPSQPEKLEEADPDLFTELAKITAPKVEYRTEIFTPPIACSGGVATPMAPGGARAELPPGVVVVMRARVGEMDATVLAFRDVPGQKLEDAAGDLLVWLNRHGYAVRPELTEWLLPYVRGKWIITAFKISGQPTEEQTPTRGATKRTRPTETVGLKASAVRLTFKTDRPFFPYREPADQRGAEARAVPRLLRVFVAASQRMAGKLGDGTTPWPGKTVWANKLKDEERIETLQQSKLLLDVAPGKWWLTEFEDRSTPRPGTDEVYFEPAADQSVVARAPHVFTTPLDPWWWCAIWVAVPVGLLVVVWHIRRVLQRPKTGGPSP